MRGAPTRLGLLRSTAGRVAACGCFKMGEELSVAPDARLHWNNSLPTRRKASNNCQNAPDLSLVAFDKKQKSPRLFEKSLDLARKSPFCNTADVT